MVLRLTPPGAIVQLLALSSACKLGPRRSTSSLPHLAIDAVMTAPLAG
jgi:hypothetical protein